MQFVIGDVIKECSPLFGGLTRRQAEHAAKSIPERGRIAGARYWHTEDMPKFLAAFHRALSTRMKYHTSTVGWKATETADGA
jgi:hypothetical protein